MRGNLKYLSDTKGECADDIDLSLIETDIEKKFISWTRILEDTISHLQQAIQEYEKLVFKFLTGSKIFDDYKCFFSNCLANLCIAITINIGKICANKNKLSLYKYNDFCKDHADIIFRKNFDSLFEINRSSISKLITNYKELIETPRNKIYGHNDDIQLVSEGAEAVVAKIDVSDLYQFVNQSKRVLLETWKLYNGHDLCFEFENSDDLKKLIAILENPYN